MDYRERFSDALEVLRTALDGRQATMWTALPAIITTFDPENLTVSAQPALQAKVRAPDGTMNWHTLPPCLDAPVIYPAGGGYTLTFPIKPGDECLLVFASRCIDLWWKHGGVQPPFDARMHDLSDAFALVGVRSGERPLADVSTNAVQLRADEGPLYIEVDKPSGAVKVVAPSAVDLLVGDEIVNLQMNVVGTLTANAPTVTITSALAATLKSPDNTISIGMNVAAGEVTLRAPTQITLDTPNVNITGGLSVQNIAGLSAPMVVSGTMNVTEIMAGPAYQYRLAHHKHSGVETGSGTSGYNVNA